MFVTTLKIGTKFEVFLDEVDITKIYKQEETDKGLLVQGGEPKAAKFETEVKYGGTLRRQLLQLQSL